MINGGSDMMPKNYNNVVGSNNTSINYGNDNSGGDQYYGNSIRDDDTDIDRISSND
jgi:hypothetical protein